MKRKVAYGVDVAEEKIFTEDEAAKYIGLRTGKTLYGWRMRGIAPKYMVYAGKSIRYRLRDLNAWLAKQVKAA